MRRTVLSLLVIAVILMVPVSEVFSSTYNTGNGWSSWGFGYVKTKITYSNNTSQSVYIRDVTTYFDNTYGSESSASTKLRIRDGYGGWAFNLCRFTQVDPGDTAVDYFWVNDTFNKYGHQVDVLNGGNLTGNCGFGFSGWNVFFNSNGTIVKYWSE